MLRRPAILWVAGVLSAAILTGYLAWFIHLQQMDFQAYRMGGAHVFGTGLYSSSITVLGWHLRFIYPPLAAVFFWPFSHLSVHAAQGVWDAMNLAALTALIAVSIAGARNRALTRSDWRTALIALAPVGLILFPVRETLLLGQINLVLALFVLIDLTIGMSWRGRQLPRGVLVGLAAAIKLTPLIFFPYLALTRQWRHLKNALLALVASTMFMFVIAPRASWTYFSRYAYNVAHEDAARLIGNQDLHMALARAHLASSKASDVVALGVLCLGLILAARAYRLASSMLGTLVCAATGLLISPISWTHYYVWIVPALSWLLAADDRPLRGERWAIAGSLIFVLPSQVETSGVLGYTRANAYVLGTLAFLGLVWAMLRQRRPTSVEFVAP